MRRAAHLHELMDEPGVDRAELASALRFIRGVNRWLGGTAVVLRHLNAWSARWDRSPNASPIRILDIATGSGDIPQAILKWAQRRHISVDLIGLDLHATTLAIAREWSTQPIPPGSSLTYLQGDALRLPFADASIDYVLTSMFFHHLSNDQVLAALREMLRVARRGIIINDLLRSRWALAGISALTLFASRIDRHDARVSVRKAWIRNEVEAWAAAIHAPWLGYHSHLFSRFTLVGERV